MKSTLVIGASNNPDRYAYKAITQLRAKRYPVVAFGQKSGTVSDVSIETQWNENWQIHTVTLYINPAKQRDYYDRILALKPKRVIFNPGTENPEFIDLLRKHNVDEELSCTLVMLTVGAY